nr:uncharacterized protein LOC117274551 [Nicotiana tomentosiformis]
MAAAPPLMKKPLLGNGRELIETKEPCRYAGNPKGNCHTKIKRRPILPPVRQVRRKFNSTINDTVCEEVENLLENGSIRESKYPKWVANVVMVKKKNEKWQMCVDFTDLNKACLKYSLPLSHIDQLIDATAGALGFNSHNGRRPAIFSGWSALPQC